MIRTKATLTTAAALLLLPAAQSTQASTFFETFESYQPVSYNSNVEPAFGDWRTVSVQSGTQVSVTEAEAVAGNPTQVLRIETSNTDTGNAHNYSMAFTEGVIELAFDFNFESSSNSNFFFYANSTDTAGTAASSTLFRMGTIAAGDRYRIGSDGGTGGYSGTSIAQTLAYGQWYRYVATIDLENRTYGWSILEDDGTPTAISFSNFNINTTSPAELQSIMFGKIGSANDLTLNVDNIAIVPEPTSLAAVLGLGTLGLLARPRRRDA